MRRPSPDPSDASFSIEAPQRPFPRRQEATAPKAVGLGASLTFRKILVLPICQSSCVPSTASAMRWQVPRRSSWGQGRTGEWAAGKAATAVSSRGQEAGLLLQLCPNSQWAPRRPCLL